MTREPVPAQSGGRCPGASHCSTAVSRLLVPSWFGHCCRSHELPQPPKVAASRAAPWPCRRCRGERLLAQAGTEREGAPGSARGSAGSREARFTLLQAPPESQVGASGMSILLSRGGGRRRARGSLGSRSPFTGARSVKEVTPRGRLLGNVPAETELVLVPDQLCARPASPSGCGHQLPPAPPAHPCPGWEVLLVPGRGRNACGAPGPEVRRAARTCRGGGQRSGPRASRPPSPGAGGEVLPRTPGCSPLRAAGAAPRTRRGTALVAGD